MNRQKICLLWLTAVLLVFPACHISAHAAEKFADVPGGHWAESYIDTLRTMGVTSGVGDNRFGVGSEITRAEFVGFLVNLLGGDTEKSLSAVFSDNQDGGAWYYNALNTAAARGITDVKTGTFRPGEAITREEMAIMLVNALGKNHIADRLSQITPVFKDVTEYGGYIAVAKELGVISGVTDTEFAPKQSATREQAAAMMVRMYNIKDDSSQIQDVNAFYAISSYNQAALMENMDSVSFGWARLETDGTTVRLNTGAENDNEYRIPQGYETVWQSAAGKKRLLMIAVKDADAAVIINTPGLRAAALSAIETVFNAGIGDSALQFDGVVLDFESLKGAESKNNYANFVKDVKNLPGGGSKLLYVAVHPQRRAGHEYYDGYDYRTIGQFADKIILMAHDYNAKSLTESEMAGGIVMTPLAPIDEVYYALSAITNAETGVQDKSKVMLQINFATAQWKMKDGAVMNQKPFTPTYDALLERINAGAEVLFDEKSQSPYAKFTNNEDGTANIVWFENKESVQAKIDLAGIFGVHGVSIWRLGTIPTYDGTQQIFMNR